MISRDAAAGAPTTRPKPLLSVAEAGRELGIRTTTAYEWARRGELPGLVRHGGRFYVRRAVLEAYIQGTDVLPTTPGPDGRLTQHQDTRREAGR